MPKLRGLGNLLLHGVLPQVLNQYQLPKPRRELKQEPQQQAPPFIVVTLVVFYPSFRSLTILDSLDRRPNTS